MNGMITNDRNKTPSLDNLTKSRGEHRIIAITESWGKPDIKDDEITKFMPDFHVKRAD